MHARCVYLQEAAAEGPSLDLVVGRIRGLQRGRLDGHTHAPRGPLGATRDQPRE